MGVIDRLVFGLDETNGLCPIQRTQENAHPPGLRVTDQVEKLLATGQKLRIVMSGLSRFLVQASDRLRSSTRGWYALQSRRLVPE